MNTDQPVATYTPTASLVIGRQMLRLLPIILLLFLTSCVTVDVINLSELNARVLIRLPDAPGGYTRLIRPSDSTSTFSNHGGRVTIQTLPGAQIFHMFSVK